MKLSVTKQLDILVAEDMQLTLSDLPVILKHVVRLDKLITGFVFAYIQNDVVHYDTSDTWYRVNGMRVRTPRFGLHPTVNERLSKHHYRRWYARSNGYLFPLQHAKVDDLKDTFYFLTDNDPTYQTSIILPMEAPLIRNGSIHQPERTHLEWGVTYRPRLKEIA